MDKPENKPVDSERQTVLPARMGGSPGCDGEEWGPLRTGGQGGLLGGDEF